MPTPNVYDTDQALPERTVLRNAVIAKLAPLLKSNGLYLAAIKPLAEKYKGAGDEEGLGDIARALQGQAPAILVALGDETYEPGGMPMTLRRATIELVVYFGSVNPRDIVQGRLENDVVAAADNTKDPGIETMLVHARSLLQGQDLGPDGIYEPDIVKAGPTHTGADFTVWEQTYHVQVDVDIQPWRRDVADPQIVVGIDNTVTRPDDAEPDYIGPEPSPTVLTETELDPP